MPVPAAIPNDVLADLGRLNSHARASAGAERDAIYAYKEAATWVLLRAGEARAYPLKWRGPCGKCDASGTFTFWDGGSAPCRGCSATGTTELRFAEVYLPDGQIWHHPWSSPRIGFIGMSMLEHAYKGDHGDAWWNELPWKHAGGWSPRAPGEKLDGPAFVETMNRVEGWVLDPGPVDPKDRWKFERAQKALRRYPLDVRDRIPERCYLCGAGAPLAPIRIGASKAWPLSWSARICESCEAVWKQERNGREWPTDLPGEAMTPAIALWMSRRPDKRPRDPWADY